MLTSLFAVLFLAIQDQDDEPQGPPPQAIHTQFVSVLLRLKRGSHPITLEMPVQAEQADKGRGPRPAQPPWMIDFKAAVLARENFDQVLFPDGGYCSDHQRYLDDVLGAGVEAAARKHGLTERQRAKLGLAGRGDIKRFFDEVQEKRGKFELDRKDVGAGVTALLQLEPLTRIYREGPFGDGSLFAKTLRKIVNEQEAGR